VLEAFQKPAAFFEAFQKPAAFSDKDFIFYPNVPKALQKLESSNGIF